MCDLSVSDWGESMKISNEIRRKMIQIAAFGFSNSYAGNLMGGKLYTGSWKKFCNPGINCYSCPAARLSCPIGAMQSVSCKANAGFGFYAAGFVLALGVLFGRAICGFVCPFGLIQDLLHKIPFVKKRIWKPLTYLKYVLLLVFVLLMPVLVTNKYGIGAPAFCKYICPAGILEGGIPLVITHPELRAMLGSLFSLKMAILVITLAGCIICCRFFCKTMCPLGAIYGLLNRISIYHMELNREKCISCGKCRTVCPMDIDPVEKQNSPECIRCGKCVAECPGQALTQTFRTKENNRLQEETDTGPV